MILAGCDETGGIVPLPCEPRRSRLAALLLLGLLVLAASCAPAMAQQTRPDWVVGCIYNTVAPTPSNLQPVPCQVDSSGNLKINGTITPKPNTGAGTVTPKTVTNSSTAFLGAAAATVFLLIKNEDTAASIALNFAGGTAVLNTAGNITLGPGMSIIFDGSFVPTGAITAISSAATSPATIILN